MFGCGKFELMAKNAALRKEIKSYERKYESEALSRKARVEVMASFAEDVYYKRPEWLQELVRMIIERTMLENAVDAFANSSKINNWGICDYLFRSYVNDSWRDKLHSIFESRPLQGTVEIELATDAILPSPWNGGRLVRDMFSLGIGTEQNVFKQSGDHIAVLYLPIGITVMEKGNHSVFCGMRRGGGKLVPNNVYDMSALYDLVFFDGTNWRTTDDEKVVAEAEDREVCAIFEMYRRLYKQLGVNVHNTRFKDVDFKPLQAH